MRFVLSFVTLLFVAVPLMAQDEQPIVLDYTSAYKLSQSGERPMLVLVTATWCSPCQQMKETTLPKLLENEIFKKFNFAMVDLDLEPEIAKPLIGERGVPQLIYFRRVGDQWIRSYVAGMQSPEEVAAFLAKCDAVQIEGVEAIAQNPSPTIEKK